MPTTPSARAAAAAIVMIAALPTSLPAAAQDAPKGYACNFRSGSSLGYAKSQFKAKPAKPFTYEIGAIDLDGQQAELLMATGKGPLRIVRALGANHFLEVLTEGYLNVTTVYDRDQKRGTHPAVHSRHFGLFGEPVIAQYVGFCTAK